MLIASAGARWKYGESSVRTNLDIHKYIQGRGNVVVRDAIARQMRGQIFETTRVGVRVLVKNTEGVRTAGSEEEIVSSDVILKDRKHRAAAIGIEEMAFRQVNRVGVVDRATG